MGMAVGIVVTWGINSIFSGRYGAEQDCGMMYSRKRKYFINVLEHKKVRWGKRVEKDLERQIDGQLAGGV